MFEKWEEKKEVLVIVYTTDRSVFSRVVSVVSVFVFDCFLHVTFSLVFALLFSIYVDTSFCLITCRLHLNRLRKHKLNVSLLIELVYLLTKRRGRAVRSNLMNSREYVYMLKFQQK